MNKLLLCTCAAVVASCASATLDSHGGSTDVGKPMEDPVDTDPVDPPHIRDCYIAQTNDCRYNLSCDGTPVDTILDAARFSLDLRRIGWSEEEEEIKVEYAVTPISSLVNVDVLERTWLPAIPASEGSVESFVWVSPSLTPGVYALAARARMHATDPWMDCNAYTQSGPIEDWGGGNFEFIPPCGEPITWPGFDPDHMRVVVVEGDPLDPACQPPPEDTDPDDTDPPLDTDPADTDPPDTF